VRRAVAPQVLELATDVPDAARVVECFYHAAPATDRPATLRYRIERTAAGQALGLAPGKPPYGPANLAEVFAFLEWRATDDLLRRDHQPAFLHAAGVETAGGVILLLGTPGSGKSTLAAHLLAAGHRVWGDDLVRFAADEMMYSAVPRSFKLDDKSLSSIDLIRTICNTDTPGTLLAPGAWYVSPAAIRSAWEAPPGTPRGVVLLDPAAHDGPAQLERTSAAEAVIAATQTLIGPGTTRPQLTEERVLESLTDIVAWRGRGADPAGLAAAVAGAL